jgi:alpha-galactosidase
MHSIFSATAARSSAHRLSLARRLFVLFATICLLGTHAVLTAAQSSAQPLALTPPMGWNDWAHYQCGFNAQTILDNATALVKSGLASRGYSTVTIDDCWMLKSRDVHGNLQPDPERFPNGMKPLADAIHHLGLKFGIYEDSGSTTCGGYAGSGWPQGGGNDHFLQDARLFASWGVDYLKLDGCNLYVKDPHDQKENLAAYRRAYAAEQAALKRVNHPIVFSESAPAYFEFSPEWYDVLTWVRDYGQLWREGDDMANYDAKAPDTPRFKSVLFNYAYNLPLGRFQKPGNWNDADFIIGGDPGMNLAETRSQIALWAMMSAPLILSSDVSKLSPEAIAILGNSRVIAIDQDLLGKDATLIKRTAATDYLIKPLKGGDYAVAVLNRGAAPAQVWIHPADLGFAAHPGCAINIENLWDGNPRPLLPYLRTDVASHDTGIWRIHPNPACGELSRSGAIVMTTEKPSGSIDGYAHCLASSGTVEECSGAPPEMWTVTARGELKSSGSCLAVADGKPALEKCTGNEAQHWNYTLAGNLVNAGDKMCLTNQSANATGQPLTLQACGHNQLNQIWSLPN